MAKINTITEISRVKCVQLVVSKYSTALSHFVIRRASLRNFNGATYLLALFINMLIALHDKYQPWPFIFVAAINKIKY